MGYVERSALATSDERAIYYEKPIAKRAFVFLLVGVVVVVDLLKARI